LGLGTVGEGKCWFVIMWMGFGYKMQAIEVLATEQWKLPYGLGAAGVTTSWFVIVWVGFEHTRWRKV